MNPLIGQFYELLLSKIIDADVLIDDSARSICPDLLLKGKKVVVESKSISCSQINIPQTQLNNYGKLLDDGFDVWYALWKYKSVRSFFKRLHDGGNANFISVIKHLITNTTGVIIIDLETLLALIDKPKYFKEYPDSYGNIYRVGAGIVENFIHNPAEIVAELGLKNYIIVQTVLNDVLLNGSPVSPFKVSIVRCRGRKDLSFDASDLSTIKARIKELVTEPEPDTEIPF